MIHSDTSTAPDNTPPGTARLKDYFCPFCSHKLFRGDVKEFRLVCQECNQLVDSSALDAPEEVSATDTLSPAAEESA